MQGQYVAMDCETGGIGDDKCLLTVYFAILDKNLNVLDELDLKVKPNDGIYAVTAKALEINKINLVEHDIAAITYEAASSAIFTFLEKNNPGGRNKLTPLGHNVAFDVRFVCQKTLSKKSWDKYCSYRTLDTGTISQFLMATGYLPATMKASLGALADHFGIKFDSHTAKGDTLACRDVLRAMMEKLPPNDY